jgi:hypothetical protein
MEMLLELGALDYSHFDRSKIVPLSLEFGKQCVVFLLVVEDGS